MKTKLKAMTLTILCVLGFSLTACADTDTPIEVNELPAKAQKMLESHFNGVKVDFAKREKSIAVTGYDVLLNNGAKIEFDRKGNWEEVECKSGAVPASLVPAQVASAVKSKYPDATIKKIEHYNGAYEVELSNGLDIKFNKKFQIVDIDD